MPAALPRAVEGPFWAVQDGDHPRRLGAVASTTGAEDPRPTLGMFEVGITGDETTWTPGAAN